MPWLPTSKKKKLIKNYETGADVRGKKTSDGEGRVPPAQNRKDCFPLKKRANSQRRKTKLEGNNNTLWGRKEGEIK